MASLEERIAARLHQALDQLEGAGMSAPTAERGLAIGGPDRPEILLTVDDIARIAAHEAAEPVDSAIPGAGNTSPGAPATWT